MFLLLLFFASRSAAKVVTLERAGEVAESFWNGQLTRSARGVMRCAWDSRSLGLSTRSDGAGDALFYVFTPSSGNGFVFVSAEDQVMPILGYSFVDAAPGTDNLPLGLQDWMEGVAAQIAYVRDNNVENPAAARLWTRAAAGSVVVELETAKWDQSAPYNDQCPLDDGVASAAGCVPVATAIVMRYHRWPGYGTGKTESYTTSTKGIYVASRDLSHLYDWGNMSMSYTSGSYTDMEADAVSTLIADIGAAFQVDYGSDSTSGSVQGNVLYAHFGYSASITNKQRTGYSDATWFQLLEGEIDASRPVLYEGHSGSDGHQFVLDGYTDDDYFHVNWGWGGSYDGYFTLSDLTPNNTGYNSNQSAWFNVEPDQSAEVEDWIQFTSPGIVLSTTDFTRYVRFTFNDLYFTNSASVDFTGSYRGALTDRDGNVKEWITDVLEHTSEPLLPAYINHWWDVSARITSAMNPGDRIRFFYNVVNTDDWLLIKPAAEIDCRWEVLVADEYTIGETTSFTFDKTNRVITLETKEGVTAELYTPEGVQITGDNGLSAAGNVITIDLNVLSKEVFTLKLLKGSEEKTVDITVKSMEDE